LIGVQVLAATQDVIHTVLSLVHSSHVTVIASIHYHHCVSRKANPVFIYDFDIISKKLHNYLHNCTYS